MALAGAHDKKTTDYTTVTQIREDRNEYSKQKNRKRRSQLLKRIPLEQLMDLKVDFAFKQLFGNEKNKDITVVFLNAILQNTGRNSIKDILFTNIELGGEYVDDKQSRLDLLVITDANERINVEIQFSDQYNMIKRSIYYWSKVFAEPLEKGMGYSELNPVIAINILNYKLFDQTERFHTSYHLYEDEEQVKLTDVMEFHFIEMGKLIKAWKNDKLNPWSSVLARWLLMLGMVDHKNEQVYHDIYKELEAIAMNDETLYKAFENWGELSTTQEQRLAYESRFKQIMDDEAGRRDVQLWAQRQVEEAEQKAEERAEERLGEVAHRLLAKGMGIEFVAESTGLTKDKVIKIHHDMQNRR
ncbi:Rpn family recombination-promoting nuclease/putative transposase [Virgibacillus natechei]